MTDSCVLTIYIHVCCLCLRIQILKESGVYTIYPYSDWFVGLSHYQQHNIGINVYRGLRNVNKEKLIQYFMVLSQ